MKIEILQKCFIGTGGNLFAGDVVEVDDAMAGKLIARGIAKEKKKRAAPKKSNRAITDIKTPESE